MLFAAAHLYRGALEGGEFDFDDPDSQVSVEAVIGSKRSIKEDLHAAEARAYELTTSARVLAKTAVDLERLHQAAGFKKIFPAIELLGRAVTEPFEVARITRSGLVGDLHQLNLQGQVDSLREDLKKVN